MNRPRTEKPQLKKWRFWVVCLIIIGSFVTGCATENNREEITHESTTVMRNGPIDNASDEPQETDALTIIEKTTAPTTDPKTAPTPEPTPAPTPEPTPAPTPEPKDVTVPVHGTDRSVSLPEGTYVWIPATGAKFHSHNDCGNMNPDKARMITVEEAKRAGYEACSKCY